ncbi:MAG: hypothetical protein HGB12_03105 [Bacteroidetes bacterium]|nr:hypothetical protein [Bacteroidota bacterium]
MKTIKIIIALTLATISYTGNAQNDLDALRYSRMYYGGTARSSSMGGAFGAIGADFSTLSINPAGLGIYRKNEFTFSPSIFLGKTASTYNDNTKNDSRYGFNISNIGLVYAFKTSKNDDKNEWKSVNFAFGLNRYNDFNNRITIEGVNHENSMVNLFQDNAQGMESSNLYLFSTQLAFDTYLIDTLNGRTNYINNFPSGDIIQRKSIETKGAMQEMVFALGANYNNKLFIGGTFGFPTVSFTQQSTYKEINNADTTLQNFTFNEYLKTTGTGVNFKLGLIYIPVDFEILKVKIGAAIHTPTFFTLHDEWSSSMKSNLKNGIFTSQIPKGMFDYQLTTPFRAIGSIAIQIGQIGIISADYEFVDYSEARLRSKDEMYFDANNTIQDNYTVHNNLRFGAEAALGRFSLRGGYALYGSPYKSNINDAARTSISGGFGIMDKSYFIDFAYVYSISKENYFLYNYDNMNPVKNKITTQSFLITLGYKF